MKPAVFVTVLCIVGFGLSPQVSTVQPLQGDTHTLGMIVLCDTFEMTGDFLLEFKGAKLYNVKDPRNDFILADFEYLEIGADSISINGKQLEENGTFWIKRLEQTKLKLLSGEDIVRRLWIKRIEGSAEKTATISFSQLSEKQEVSFGENSIVSLENYYSSTNCWDLELHGEFQIVDDENNPIIDEEYDIRDVMREAQITFTGSLTVWSPKGPKADSLRLQIEFCDDVEKLYLENEKKNGKAEFKSPIDSALESSENQFKSVIEDNFKIDMDNDYYNKNNDFIRDFYLENIEKMDIKEIREDSGKLLVTASEIEYHGDTRFPKILITTKYFLVNKGTEEKSLMAEISNLTSTYCEEKFLKDDKVEFLTGKEYRVYIYIEKLVEDDIIVDLEDINCDYFKQIDKASKLVNDIELGYHKPDDTFEYSFEVDARGIDETPECWTKVSYGKKNQGSKPETAMTKSFKAKISSDINLKVSIKENEYFKGKKIKEGQKFHVYVEIELLSEISFPLVVDAFLIPDERFKVEGGQIHKIDDEFTKGKPPLTLYVALRAPPVDKKEETCNIEILVYYYMKGETYHGLHREVRCHREVREVVVRSSYWYFFREFYPVFISFTSFMIGIFISLQFMLRNIVSPANWWKFIPILFKSDMKRVCSIASLKKEEQEIVLEAVDNGKLTYEELWSIDNGKIEEKAGEINVEAKVLRALKKKIGQIENSKISIRLYSFALISMIIALVLWIILHWSF